MSSLPLARLAALCERYGPGRLPYADRQAIGAGYAMATTAVVAAVAFVLAMQLPGLPQVLPTGDDAVFFGLRAIPLVVPFAFVAGVVLWQPVPESAPSLSGHMAGLFVTVLTYVGATLGLASVGVVLAVFQDAAGLATVSVAAEGVLWALSTATLVGAYAFVLTFWLTLPLGALGGHVYDATRT